MSQVNWPIGEDDLHAWVDGRLSDERAEQVSSWLACHPADALRVEAYRRQRDELRAWLAPRAEAPVPTRLRVATLGRRRPGLHPMAAVAAAAVLFVAGGGAGWVVRDAVVAGGRPAMPAPFAAEPFAAGAMLAHVTYVAENRHAVEVPASQEEHLIRWLSNRLGRKLVVPALEPMGFQLMGGRLLPAGNVPAAQFMYEDGRGTRLTLYMRAEPEQAATGFAMVERGGVSGFQWTEGGFGYIVLAETARDRLLAVAESVNKQLTPLAGSYVRPE